MARPLRFRALPLLLPLLAEGVSGGIAEPAHADWEKFYVAPDESRVRIDSARFEVRVPWSDTHLLYAEEQGGLPGTTPGSLPGGGTSDGFETSISGELLVNNELVTLNKLTVDSEATTLVAGDMGSWHPGADGGPGPDPANAAFVVTTTSACSPGSCVGVSLDITAAIRGFEATIDGPLNLSPLGPDLWSASGFLTLTPVGGTIEYDSTLPGFSNQTPLPTESFVTTTFVMSTGGRYEVLEPDLAKLTLPFTTDPILLLPSDLAPEVDGSVNTATLSGEIVAYSQPVPEPDALALLGAGVGLLRVLHRRRQRRAGGCRR